jgi:TPP-dependent pyruvate/acetoin dehydrogenase alpha subunit
MTTPPPTREHGHALLREMLRIRRFEEKAAEAYSAGKTGDSSTFI